MPFPALDSERTLITVFGVPEYLQSPGPIAELRRAYPSAVLIGCSAAGEILDGSLAAGRPGGKGDDVAIVVSCVGRRLVLGERAEEEVEAAAQSLGSAKLVGFYSYGEISPLSTGRCQLHNQTMTLTRLWEE